mgnify:CR=1 FL=1
MDDIAFIHSMTAKSNTHGPAENQMGTGWDVAYAALFLHSDEAITNLRAEGVADDRMSFVGNTMAVWVNGQPLTRFTDSQSPYSQGQVGLYAEDAYAQFADVVVAPPSPSSITNPTGTGATPTSR